MHFSMSCRSYFGRVGGVTAVMIGMAVCVSAASAAGPPGMGYDIPLSELNKVRKDAPPKRVKGETKRKKPVEAQQKEAVVPEQKNASESTVLPDQHPPAAITAPAAGETAPVAAAEPAFQVKTPVVESQAAVSSVEIPPRPAAISAPAAGTARIHHSPFSFVVAGKRTVVQAVVSSDADVKTVTCRIPSKDGSGAIVVAMVKMNGTQFTYTATLPGVAAGSTSLRYTIDVVDSLGRETRSPEFSTPVTASPILPGWQLDAINEPQRNEAEQIKKAPEAVVQPSVAR